MTAPELTKVSPPPAAVPQNDDVCVLPMSFGQEQLWLIDRMAPGNSAYNVLAPFRIRGLLDAAILERTLNEIVRRHEVLRTTFDLDETGPVQIITSAAKIPFVLHDLSGVPELSREVELLQHLSAAGTLPFDLKHGPLCRAHLFKLSHDHHVLLWNMHHVVSDGWSYTILTEEIGAILPAFLRGEPCPLPELPIQYADFSQWQRAQFTPDRIAAETAWWQQRLEGAPALIELPTDRPFGPDPSFDGRVRTLHFQPELIERLQALSKELDATFFTVTFAAYFVLMHRYTGQSEIVAGTPIANRGRVELEPLIGYFVNTVPIRLSIGEQITFRELVTQLQTLLGEVYEHQELPFERLVGGLARDRSGNRNPIFQVSFQCHKAFLRMPEVAGLEFSHIHIDRHGTSLDLNFALIGRDGSWRISIEYSTEVFDETTIDRMLGHYQTLLEGIVSNPNGQIASLPLLSPSDFSHQVTNFNASPTTTGYPRDASLGELFELEVLGRPEAVAVEWEGGSLTYGELNGRANRVARRLREVGVGLETLVGVHVERSVAYVVSVLGVLKAGGAYVPLEPDYPAARLGFMVADAGLRVVITDRPWPVGLARPGLTVVDLIKDAPLIAACAADNPAPVSTGESLAYVIYTSGSTGQPKGVAIPQRGVVRLVRGQSYADFGAGQRFLLLAATSFDASTFELWGPLLNGGVCVIFPPQPLDFQQLETVIRRHGITCLWLTAGLFNQLLDDRPSVLATVRHVLAGGEALSVRHVRQALALGLRVTNGYGPTECTTFACTYALEPGMTFPQGTVPIGRPIAHTRCHVLDQRLQPVPVGVAGELYLGGDGLARGYLNQPALTAEKFIADPFTAGGRLYQTGDLARYRADGNLEFLGRRDSQVKLRGFRIELGEIEAVLATHPNLRNAAVLVREDRPGEKTLAAYLVLRATPAPTATELRAFLARQLPDYMLPAAFIHLDQLPLTPNGKLDRRALPAPGQNRLAQGIEFVPPRSPTEAKLAHIWQDLLARNPIGIHENFFALGGHSLLAVRVVNEIKRRMNVLLPIRTLFQYPTIQKLADFLATQNYQTEARKPELIELQSGKVGPELFFLIDEGSLGLFKLARLLDKDLSLYASVVPLPETALKASLKKDFAALPRMEDLAAGHVALIKSHRKNCPADRPLLLAGHCFGGKLAFEVARQLQAAGIRVETVLLLDTWMTRTNFWWHKKIWLREHFGQLLKQGPLYLWRKSRRRIKLEKEQLAARLELAIRDDFSLHVPWAIIVRIYRHAMNGYRPKPLTGRGIVLLSQDDWMSNAYRSSDDTLGAGSLFTDGVEVINVPGNHVTLLDEAHLPELAACFKKSLDQFRGATP